MKLLLKIYSLREKGTVVKVFRHLNLIIYKFNADNIMFIGIKCGYTLLSYSILLRNHSFAGEQRTYVHSLHF